MSVESRLDRIEAQLKAISAKLGIISQPASKPSQEPLQDNSSKIEWLDTKNPKIKRVSEVDAPSWLLERAQERKTKGLWYMGPSEGYEFGSVFKDTSKFTEA